MTEIKICGLTTKAAIDAAIQSGASYLGFVFAESPRKITPENVRTLTQDLPEKVKKVGVFVSPTKEFVEEIVKIAQLDFVQIHGEKKFQQLDVPIIRAKSVIKNVSLTVATGEDFLLLDAPPTKYMGGNGQRFDWSAVAVQQLEKEKLWLAGGLTAENVGEAIVYFQPKVVDVSSGVETDGKKDLAKISAFCEAVRIADNS
ncbi:MULTISPECIES: phosphoribosylanthranilate isomerase [Enterococcus]|uniref:phosphoribosylanthranilate isomerase n=1 Tax=Enterococcus TaxID=1350 RepID=UPI0011069201|nr:MULTISPECIES: phosphoribosylanthranilate isomerase [Enterococcus]MDB1679402.1 phosphoribosylanthranilate isomerase [Enterococcus durans]